MENKRFDNDVKLQCEAGMQLATIMADHVTAKMFYCPSSSVSSSHRSPGTKTHSSVAAVRRCVYLRAVEDRSISMNYVCVREKTDTLKVMIRCVK